MRLQKFINEGRSKKISKEQVQSLLEKNCKDALLNDNLVIYRGLKTDSDALYLHVSPAAYTRVSRNTDNFYTLLLDNLPKWKAYPKRSKSIICSSDSMYAGNMGDPYRVFPYDNANLAICPNEDIWGSFMDDVGDLSGFNWQLFMLAKHSGLSNMSDTVRTYSDLLSVFEKIDERKKEGRINTKNFNYMSFFEKYLYNKNLTLLQCMIEVFDPDDHDFELKTPKTYKRVYKREIWTDSPCVLVISHLANEIVS